MEKFSQKWVEPYLVADFLNKMDAQGWEFVCIIRDEPPSDIGRGYKSPHKIHILFKAK